MGVYKNLYTSIRGQRAEKFENHCPSSSADCTREQFKGSNGLDSLLDCTRKKIFWFGVADFLWVTP